MTDITAGMVKELRERTGLGMMECKKALTETDGDMQAAEDLMRIKSGAKASKAASRGGSEGVVGAFISVDGKTGALVEVNVLHRVHEARDVVRVLRQRLAVFAGDGVDDVHGGTGGSEVHLLAPRLHVVLRVLRMQHEVPRRHRQRVFDERPREQQPTFGANGAALRQQVIEAR